MTEPAPRPRSVKAEMVRFGVTGLALNVSLFSVYVALVSVQVPPLLIAGVLYPFGVFLSYVAHRRITFRSKAHLGTSGFRFILSYGAGYLLNLAVLWVQIHRLGIDPIWAQAIAIVLVAAFLFIAQKFWVFAGPVRAMS